MIHGVVLTAGISDDGVGQAQARGQAVDLILGAGDADKLGAEIVHVLGQFLRLVTLRVYRKEHHLQRLAQAAELGFHALELGHSGRAEIGAVGEAGEKQMPFALQLGITEFIAVLVDQAECGQGSGLLQLQAGGQRRGVRACLLYTSDAADE